MGGVPGLEQNYLYGQYAQGGSVPFGAYTVNPRVEGTPVVQPARHTETPTVGSVVGEAGTTPISMGTQAVGFGTTYAEGAGSHYTNGVGHSLHTKWLIG